MMITIKPENLWTVERVNSSIWYKAGELYDVEPYRHTPERYWEVKGWDGLTGWNHGRYWIMRDHAVPHVELPKELFEL